MLISRDLPDHMKNTILLGDCIEKLKEIPDRSVDLIILDPPYWKVVSEKWDFEWKTKSDYVQWCELWLKEISRVVKLSGSMYLFGYTRNLVPLFPVIENLGFTFRQDITIDKGMQSLGGRKTSTYKLFPTTTENLWFFNFNSKPYIKPFLKERQKELGLTAKEINEKLGVKSNGGGVWSFYTGNNVLAQVPTKELWNKLEEILDFSVPYENIAQTFNIELGLSNVWTDINFYEKNRIHPTQKPVSLIERIIKASSNEGMNILDPFMGSGTTAISCINLNRNYIGIEKDPDYLAKTEKRILDRKSTQTLF